MAALIIILAVAAGLAAGWLLRGWLRPAAAPVAVGHETPLPGRCGAPIGAGRYCKRGEGCNLRGHREATGRAPLPADVQIASLAADAEPIVALASEVAP